jgi:hypothetical protein
MFGEPAYNQEFYPFQGEGQFINLQCVFTTVERKMGLNDEIIAEQIRLLSIEGRKVRILLKDDRVINLQYESEEALDHDLREWAAQAGYSLPQTSGSFKGENDIKGYGP